MNDTKVIIDGAWYALDHEALRRGHQNIVACAPTLKELDAILGDRKGVVLHWVPAHEVGVTYDSSYWRGE